MATDGVLCVSPKLDADQNPVPLTHLLFHIAAACLIKPNSSHSSSNSRQSQSIRQCSKVNGCRK